MKLEQQKILRNDEKDLSDFHRTELEEIEEGISLLKAQNEEFDKGISNLEKHIDHAGCKTRLKLDGTKEKTRGVPEIDKLKHILQLAASQGEQQKDILRKQALDGKDKQLYQD